ncbi:hypothetical protein [Streptomyces sp. NPDC004266]|uniref:hypothetical protein n=1 Tax=Streptomyces sp. NPDC004266 TaxID=3364693 RepID=UPI0036C4463F
MDQARGRASDSADADRLAGLPVVQAAAAEAIDLEGEQALNIAWDARETATGTELPGDGFTINYLDFDPAWDFDCDDHSKVAARLPRIAAPYPE